MIQAQQMPGLAIVLEARTFASALRIEAKAFAGGEGLDGEHVPDIERDDVGDKNVNVVGGVNHLALSVDRVDGLDVVTAGAHDFGALELDAPEAMTDKKAQPAAAPEFHLDFKYGTLRWGNGTWVQSLFSYWNEVGGGNWTAEGT